VPWPARPPAYPQAPAAVAVLFSGLLTKVGAYAIIRIYAVVLDGTPGLRPILMAAALLTLLVGVLGALGEKTMRGILSFDMVSQIGYALLGLALFTESGLAAAIFFLLQYALVKAALFACAAAVEVAHGTGYLTQLGGVARREPMLATAFMLSALSLAGVPPLSGFVAKLALVTAAVAERDYVATAVAVTVSLLTLLAMLKIWGAVFWSEPLQHRGRSDAPEPRKARPAIVVPALALAAPSIVLGLGAQPVLAAVDAAANGLLDQSAYVQAVTQ
jgi:multicomponent Na+:H+ antiporter subunit D